MNENDKQNLITEARQYAVAAPSLLPLLETRKTQAIQKLIGRFRNGETELLATIAEIAGLQSLEDEIKRKIQTLDGLEKIKIKEQ